MDQTRPVRPLDQSHTMRQAWKDWATWSNLGLLLAAAVLPLGWLLPAARFARERAMTRRGRPR